jgi:DNA-binding response OmpR family regulator
MNITSDVSPLVIKGALAGRILVVDDDPIVAGMLGATLAAGGHQVFERNSGEDALVLLNSSNENLLPDIVILDIEMEGGIDGYETCRRLRLIEACRETPVIFLSGHDELDDRLRAYDAGGDDFMAKPFDPDEVVRKAGLAIHHKRRQKLLAAEGQSSTDTAMSAINMLGESGVTLKFSRGALGCRTLRALAKLTLESMGSFDVDCHVQLRTPTETLTLTCHGPASPLEESVLEKLRSMERIFSFKSRMIVNYDSVSLLVTNMPIADEELCGRIRDHAATIAESAELAVSNINLRNEAILRSDELRRLANTSRAAVESLRENFRNLQASTCLELENMTNTIEGLYVYLGLTDMQELTISEAARGAVDRVLTLFESAKELDSVFAGIVEDLTVAGDFQVIQEDEPMPTVELW